MAHTPLLSQADLYKFKISLVYVVSSRIASSQQERTKQELKPQSLLLTTGLVPPWRLNQVGKYQLCWLIVQLELVLGEGSLRDEMRKSVLRTLGSVKGPLGSRMKGYLRWV